jgi:hypothetical protein
VLQPGMGLGIAGSKTPRPNVVRLRALLTHTVFGVGLYLSALASSLWRAPSPGDLEVLKPQVVIYASQAASWDAIPG